ncbi:envelope glycoprotein N [Cervid alphaherpesvirus 2]|uniref:Envelope glycoprotein N n=1 Tax=Cervid alphaherpesvirus 2 TaxID=365327 RepID=A0A455JNU0_9ALPH|nr:envelope glycoprotein N [Cervid alphaherpesvirus 2]AVT50730.1 envelope glycoprotein N [Cervid alphaherpesvirus 2]
MSPPRPALALALAAALLAIAWGRDPLLDALRHEGAMDFWSASCYARGVPLTEPPQALVLFYVALVALVFAGVVYAYGVCHRLMSADLANNRRATRGRG